MIIDTTLTTFEREHKRREIPSLLTIPRRFRKCIACLTRDSNKEHTCHKPAPPNPFQSPEDVDIFAALIQAAENRDRT